MLEKTEFRKPGRFCIMKLLVGYAVSIFRRSHAASFNQLYANFSFQFSMLKMRHKAQ